MKWIWAIIIYIFISLATSYKREVTYSTIVEVGGCNRSLCAIRTDSGIRDSVPTPMVGDRYRSFGELKGEFRFWNPFR